MATAQETDNAPRLEVLNPRHLQGSVFALTGGHVLVGRQPGCELLLDDETVSRAHAQIERSGGRTTVADLGSSNGTTVNGQPIDGTKRALRSGDTVGFGKVEMRFQVPGTDTDATASVAVERPHAVEYRVENQTAGRIDNVGRDQYNAYVQQRDSFARDIASTRTKASRLVWIGLAMFVLGGGTYGWAILRFAGQVDGLSIDGPEDTFQPPSLFGPEVGGVPVGVIGFAVAGLGSILLVVGIVLHVIAASRRRRLDTQLPAPWPSAPPPTPQGW